MEYKNDNKQLADKGIKLVYRDIAQICSEAVRLFKGNRPLKGLLDKISIFFGHVKQLNLLDGFRLCFLLIYRVYKVIAKVYKKGKDAFNEEKVRISIEYLNDIFADHMLLMMKPLPLFVWHMTVGIIKGIFTAMIAVIGVSFVANWLLDHLYWVTAIMIDIVSKIKEIFAM